MGKVRVNVESKAVRSHPTANMDAESGNLFVPNPYPRVFAVLTVRCQPKFVFKQAKECLLNVAHKRMYVLSMSR